MYPFWHSYRQVSLFQAFRYWRAFIFFALLFTSHRSPLSERLEQAIDRYSLDTFYSYAFFVFQFACKRVMFNSNSGVVAFAVIG